MRSLPFPRRLQLVKLLRAHGVRDVERLREDELREALARLEVLLPEPGPATPWTPPPASVIHQEARSKDVDLDANLDWDDPHCLPRFREPRAFLPDHERTFLRVIAVAPRRLYATWDVHRDLLGRRARLDVVTRDFLGVPPSGAELSQVTPAFSVDVDLNAPGWYVEIPADRLAVQVRLFVDGDDGLELLSTSNVALAPPARPAPPGPLWMATLQPGVDRRTLRGGVLVRPQVSEQVVVEALGDAPAIDNEEVILDPANSTARLRLRERQEAPSSGGSSSSFPAAGSSHTLAGARS